jgi:hypothetical protein
MSLFKARLHWHVEFGFKTSNDNINFLFKKKLESKEKKGQYTSPHKTKFARQIVPFCNPKEKENFMKIFCQLFLDF